MDAKSIWVSFCQKLLDNSLCDTDFSDEMRLYLIDFLIGPKAQSRRLKFAYSPADFYDSDSKAIVMLKCTDDDYRFDFIKENGFYKLAFIECITLPVSDIKSLPYSDFTPLPEKEPFIRSEISITKSIRHYLKFKELLGKDEAVKLFLDGKGESTGARSWVPFYNGSLSFIAYTAWIEKCINGEDVVIEEFSKNKCTILFRNHLWRRVYNETGHFKTQISYNEYMELFEAIWVDKASASGWYVEFEYEENDTILKFIK